MGLSPAKVTFFRLNVVIWVAGDPKFCDSRLNGNNKHEQKSNITQN